MEGNPSGERNSMVTPSLKALRANEVKVRTTPLTCGCQASVAMSTRIRLRAPRPRTCRGTGAQSKAAAGLQSFCRIACRDNCDFVSQLYDKTCVTLRICLVVTGLSQGRVCR